MKYERTIPLVNIWNVILNKTRHTEENNGSPTTMLLHLLFLQIVSLVEMMEKICHYLGNSENRTYWSCTIVFQNLWVLSASRGAFSILSEVVRTIIAFNDAIETSQIYFQYAIKQCKWSLSNQTYPAHFYYKLSISKHIVHRSHLQGISL